MRRRVRDEAGVTLVEVLVASTLGLVVMVMGYTFLNSGTHAATTIAARASNSTNARLALDDLEANLRYANGVWISGSGAATVLTVENAAASSDVVQPPCAQWSISSGSLVEVANTVAAPTTSTTTTVMANVTAGTPVPFAIPVTDLVQFDFSVNGETVRPVNADAVTVHGTLAPDDLATAQSVAASGACTP